MAIRYPSAQDQYIVELINKDRLDPQAAADFYLGGNLNKGLYAGTISTTLKLPLAFNLNLNSAAEGHSQWMLDNDTLSHTGEGGTTSQQRMVNYENLFIDKNYDGRGHRVSIMNRSYQEIGISSLMIVSSENVKQDIVSYSISIPMVFTVTNNADSGSGSLRQAIIDANANMGTDTIMFDNSLSGLTINLTSGELIITDNLTITGLGEDQLTIDGGGNNRIFRLKSTSVDPKSLTVENLTLTNGFATPTDVMAESRGGAITTENKGILTVQGVTFTSNIANDGGGAIYSAFEGQLTVIDSQFLNNQAIGNNNELGGGAISFRGTGKLLVQDSNFIGNKGINGGAIYNLQGSVTVENSTFISNDVLSATVAVSGSNPTLRGYGGAFYSDRASSSSSSTSGTIKFVNSVFENNQGRAAGGAIYVFTGGQDNLEIQGSAFRNNQTVGLQGGEKGNGGAIELQSNEINKGLIIVNSEFSNNRAVDRGGAVRTRNAPTQIFNSTFSNNATTFVPTPGVTSFEAGLGGAMELGGSVNVKITNVTLADNFATWVGGAIAGTANIELNNSILYNNTADNGNNDWGIQQQVIPGILGSNNIQFPNNGNGSSSQATPGIVTANPLIGLLSDNGGITRTRKLLTGSPALNAGNNSLIPLDLLDVDNDGNTTETTPFDQRGNSFKRIGNGIVDIGAYEVQPPVITSSSFSIEENLTQVGTIQATDVDGDTLTYSITGGLDNLLFQINSNTGLLTFISAPDFENPVDSNGNNVYEVEITANDGLLDSQPVLISVTVTDVIENINQSPVITSSSFSLEENLTQVGTIQATDADGDTLTYSITGGLDNLLFQINSNTGLLTFISAPDFENPVDSNGNNVYEVEITANDGLLDSQPVLISVTVKDITENLISGTTGNDTVNGTNDVDEINALSGDDLIRAGDRGDIINGGEGKDRLYGDNGSDIINGGADDDFLDGGADDDFLDGGNGNDQIYGGNGNDTLLGGIGNDYILGEAGDDLIDGGKGGDRLRGGAGIDTFVLRSGDGRDIIYDFTDTIDIIGLSDGLTFANLGIAQFGSRTDITQIADQTDSNAILALLVGVTFSSITAEDFTTVS